MKSVLDAGTRDELVTRIGTLHTGSTRGWGKMSLSQMLDHCVRCEKFYFGEIKVKRSFLGRLIGGSVIKKLLVEGVNLSRNAPTNPVLLPAGKAVNSRGDSSEGDTQRDIETGKQNWIRYIRQYADLPHQPFTHWFFGKLTPDQVGQFIYKHADHHLRQFGA